MWCLKKHTRSLPHSLPHSSSPSLSHSSYRHGDSRVEYVPSNTCWRKCLWHQPLSRNPAPAKHFFYLVISANRRHWISTLKYTEESSGHFWHMAVYMRTGWSQCHCTVGARTILSSTSLPGRDAVPALVSHTLSTMTLWWILWSCTISERDWNHRCCSLLISCLLLRLSLFRGGHLKVKFESMHTFVLITIFRVIILEFSQMHLLFESDVNPIKL